MNHGMPDQNGKTGANWREEIGVSAQFKRGNT
jgi:hypothetical protein